MYASVRMLHLNNQLNKLYCFPVSIYSTCHQSFSREWPYSAHDKGQNLSRNFFSLYKSSDLPIDNA